MLRRHLVALVVLAVLPLTGAALVVGASPSSAKAVTVRAPQVSTPHPIGTEAVTLTGRLGTTVKRLAKLQQRRNGHWVVVARRTVGPKGRYAFRVAMPAASARWRVVAPPVRKHGKKWKQRVSRARVVYRALQTAYAAPVRSVKVGTATTVSLAFAPARPGRRAALQVNEGSGWRTLADVAQNSAGRASYRWTPRTTGMVQLRAVAAPFHGARQIVGPASSLAVLSTTPVQVAAHRGASLRNPENTVPAIKNAVKLGADWLELDVRALEPDIGADGAPQQHFILLHDPTFVRTTDVERVFPGSRNLGTAQFTWPEVQRLDAGSWKGARFTGARVPDLRAALDAITQAEEQYHRQVRVILEFKGDRPAMFAALYDQVKALRPDWISPTGHDDKVVFMSFDYASVFETVRQDDATDGAEFAGVMDSTADRTYDWLSQMHVNSSLASAATLQRVHAGVPQAAVYTVDSPTSILLAATAGADIVTTDDVETARSVLLR